MGDQLHDTLTREEKLEPGSPRGFGLVMAGFFAVVAGFSLWNGSPNVWRIWLPLAAGFALAAWLVPSALRPLNHVWFRFGLLLHKVVSPLVMALIFFGAVLPVGALMRLFGKRPLAPGFDRAAETYWTVRPRDAQPGPMSKQY